MSDDLQDFIAWIAIIICGVASTVLAIGVPLEVAAGAFSPWCWLTVPMSVTGAMLAGFTAWEMADDWSRSR